MLYFVCLCTLSSLLVLLRFGPAYGPSYNLSIARSLSFILSCLLFSIAGFVVVEVGNPAVGAVLGASGADFVVVAFGVAVVVCEVGEGDVGGVGSPDVVDDAG